ncbi:MAG: tyrosine-type recombinase/integrase [Nitrospirota bacterium]
MLQRILTTICWGYPLKSRLQQKVIKGLKDVERIRYITPDEAKKLKVTLPDWLKPMVIVAVQTGLRESNIAFLEQSECDFSRDAILIPGEKMKNGKPCIVKMSSLVRQTLKQALHNRKANNPYVFTDEHGKPHNPKKISMAFRRACQRAGIKNLRFHDLRHDFASTLANEGANLYQIQRMLGHSDPRMTQRYAHLLPENLNAVNYVEGKGTAAALVQNWCREEKEKGYISVTP